MVANLKELRKPTLTETYVNLNQLIQKESKENLQKLVKNETNCDLDAFDQSLRLIIVDRTENTEELSRILFETDSNVIRRAVKCKWYVIVSPICL